MTSYPSNDKLFFTTVGVGGAPGESKLTLFDALRGWFDSSTAVVPKELLFPPEATGAQVNCENQQEQDQSQNNAKAAALRALHYTVPVETRVYVDSFAPRSPAEAAGIDICDDIVSINGTSVSSIDQLTTLISEHKAGEVVRVGWVDSEGKAGSSMVRLTTQPGTTRPLIGIVPKPRTITRSPVSITIDAGAVGGPSAGLMYALSIVEQLTPGDLTGGVVVAGTGEITADGKVGEIGGIQQKLITARDHHATVFLVPHGNCADAVHAKPKGLRLVDVSTLAEALQALAAVRGDADGVIHDCTA